MSHFHYETIKCPYCLNEEETPVWDLVDLDLDPELKQDFLEKKMQTFICSNCDRSYFLENPFLLVERSQNLVIYYNPHLRELLAEPENRLASGNLKPEFIEQLPQDLGFDSRNMHLRLITEPSNLAEKILINDQGLDDLLIEVVKLAMRFNLAQAQAEENKAALDQPLRLLYFQSIDEENKKLLFHSYTEEEEWQILELEASVYQQISSLAPETIAKGSWAVVDPLTAQLFTQELETKL